MLPFREEQNELTKAVAALNPNEAYKTVAFAHLAINKAITQRYVIKAGVNSHHAANFITYHGLTGPDWFASLARTITGHFHSHQTITQERLGETGINLQGSMTYLGSPLQLSWADLYDEQRGVILFDPETLEHELITNPHAIGYVAINLERVLDDQVDINIIADKHVMLIGNLTHLKYATARDKLLSLGARSLRNWTPAGVFSKSLLPPSSGLGFSVPASDVATQVCKKPTENEICPATPTDVPLTSDATADPRVEKLDLNAEVHEYVNSVDLDRSLLSQKDDLVRIGHRIIQVSHETIDHEEVTANYMDFLHTATQVDGTRTATEMIGSSTRVFVATPHTLTITNFLSIQDTIVIDFQQDIPRGLTFLIGENGSGKSTLIEAMTWCQFGQYIRGGLTVNDIMNDIIGKNCFVKLDFANGYSITRYRKHKVHKNRVVISLHSEPQTQLKHPDAQTTQEAINELLGTNFRTYTRTVILSHGSATSFLNSTPTQRRELIEASLRLSILDQYGKVSRVLLKSIDIDMNMLEAQLEGVKRTKDYNERRLEDLERTQERLEAEAEEAIVSLERSIHEQAKHEMLFTKLEKLAVNREMFIFWSSALSKRSRRASSSSTSSTEKVTANFRDHILTKSISELNGLLIQILTVLYDDTRHTHIATGMLRSLFDSDSGNAASNSSPSGCILNHTLAVHPSLAYSKRSSGERKRIDLALFFALLQLVRARSAHRAHYALVDEVFDNLDNAGQEAVIRWCGVMLQTAVGWVVVITHSQFLVDRDPEVDTCKVLVVNARMGKLVSSSLL
ncbi:hypothetical protein FAVG1_07090 [Fusarium avenaceum]|nr:hypothetical protein FAVG1_07090 [Fusarium avenaceum]